MPVTLHALPAHKTPRPALSAFWVFPQNHHSADPATSVVRRHHLYDQTFQRAFKRAAQAPGVAATMI